MWIAKIVLCETVDNKAEDEASGEFLLITKNSITFQDVEDTSFTHRVLGGKHKHTIKCIIMRIKAFTGESEIPSNSHLVSPKIFHGSILAAIELYSLRYYNDIVNSKYVYIQYVRLNDRMYIYFASNGELMKLQIDMYES